MKETTTMMQQKSFDLVCWVQVGMADILLSKTDIFVKPVQK